MSKNMTRKGLALGAGLGLLSAGLVGVAPAQAAETLALTPSSGTSYKVLTTSEFELTVGFAGTESAAAVDTVKFLVTNASGAALALDVVEAGLDTGNASVEKVGAAGTAVAANTATSQVAYEHGANAIGSQSGLQVSIATLVADTSFDVGVQAWLDIDGDNVIDANEPTSPVRTIQFVDHASVAATATLDTAVVGAASLSATVSIPGFNMDQLDSDDVKVEFFKNNVTLATTDDTNAATAGTGFAAGGDALTPANRKNPQPATWSSANAEMRSTLYPEAADAGGADTDYNHVLNVATAVYTAKVRLYDGTAWQTVSGSVGSATPASGQVSALTAISELNSASTDGSDNVRVGSGSFTAYTTATINAGIAKAGQTVTFKIQEATANSIATTASISAGGKTLTNSNIGTVQYITVDVLTDALGVAYLPVEYSGIVAANTFKISASALNTTAAATTQAAITYTAVASDVYKVVSNVYNGNLQTVIGSSFSVTWRIVDTFGQVPVGTYRLVVTENGTANYAQNLTFVNGVATLTQTENATAAGSYVLSADVEQQNTDGSWDATPTAANGALAGDVNVTVYAADPAVAAISVTASDDGTTTGGNALDLLLDGDLFSGHTDLDQAATAKPTLADNIDNSANATVDYDDGVATLTWTVTSSTGELLVGEPITVSGAGLQFRNGTKVYGVGSISGTTNTSGQFAVEVYSNIAGKHTVTAVAGGVTKTDTLTFRQAKADTATVITTTAPAAALPGSTFTAKVTLADKYGNPVITDSTATGYVAGTTTPTFAITYTGPGLTVGTLPTKTGADGSASFNVLLGSNDTGSISIVATYDADGTATAKAAISSTAEVNGAAVGSLATWTKNLGSGEVKMYAKNIVGAGKVQFMLNGEEIAWVNASSSADSKLRSANGFYYLVRTVELVEGQKNVLEIYVDGVRTTRTAYTY